MTDDAYSPLAKVLAVVLQVMFVPLFSPLTSTISFVNIISAIKLFLIVTLTRLAVKLPNLPNIKLNVMEYIPLLSIQ